MRYIKSIPTFFPIFTLMVFFCFCAAACAPDYAARSPVSLVIISRVSRINASMKANLQTIRADGLTKGRPPGGQIGQWGDSITHSMAYLAASLNSDSKTQDNYSYGPIVGWMGNLKLKNPDNWGEHPYPASNNYGNYSGWQTTDWLADGAAIIKNVNPSWALIMFGTNDLRMGVELSVYKDNLTNIVNTNIDAGVIPVLSTIPPQTIASDNARIPGFNAAIKEIAAAKNIPYVDLWGLYEDLHPNNWAALSDGDVHPNYGTGGGADIGNDETLKNNGYLLRSVLTAEMAEKLKTIVWDDREPDI